MATLKVLPCWAKGRGHLARARKWGDSYESLCPVEATRGVGRAGGPAWAMARCSTYLESQGIGPLELSVIVEKDASDIAKQLAYVMNPPLGATLFKLWRHGYVVLGSSENLW